MKANLKNRTIEMTKAEANAAGRIGSEEFEELKKYQNAYPDYRICILATHKRKSKYSGLDYKFMTNYIMNCERDDKDKILEKFNELRGVGNENRSKFERVEAVPYAKVKNWFLSVFPEIQEKKKEQRKKIEDILNVA